VEPQRLYAFLGEPHQIGVVCDLAAKRFHRTHFLERDLQIDHGDREVAAVGDADKPGRWIDL
jgi:hypothetical protein